MGPDLVQLAADALPTGAAVLAVVAVFVALDAVLPVLPSETAVVTLGVLAAADAIAIPAALLVITAAAIGGDVASFTLGRTFTGHWARLRQSPTRRGAALRAADAALVRQGTTIVASARFVPGGRTAVTLSAGAAGVQRRRFVAAAAVGALAWTGVFLTLGYVGGRVVGDNLLLGLAVGLALVVLVSAVTEAVRRARGARRAHPDDGAGSSVTAVAH